MRSGALRETTEAGRRFVALAEGHVDAFRARAAAHDAAASFPVESFAELGQSGVLGACVPEKLGGLGLGSVHDWAVGMERLGEADASTAIALNMHLAITRTMAQAWHGAVARGDEAASARSEGLLRAVARGELIVCATATEAGTDFLRPQTTATLEGDTYVIEGRKIFVTLSPVAGLCAMNLRVPTPEGDQFAFAFVPMSTPGLEPQDDWDALGMRGSGSQSVVLRGCRVPASAVQIVGEWGKWSVPLLMGRTLGNITLVAVFLGIAERARTLAIEAATKQTKAKHGGAIANAPGIRHLMGQIEVDIASARAILGDTTARIDEFLAETAGGGPGLEAAHRCMRDYQAAKWVVNQNAIAIVSRAMDICGGGAYLTANELSRLYRDVRAGPFMQPFAPNETHDYLGQIALGMLPEG